MRGWVAGEVASSASTVTASTDANVASTMMNPVLDALMPVVKGRHRRGEGGCWLGAGQRMYVYAFTCMDFTHFLPDAAAGQPPVPVLTSTATCAQAT